NTKVMYVGVFGNGVYRSTDGGASFEHLADSPAFPVQGKVDTAGHETKLYTTFVTGEKYSGGGVTEFGEGSGWTDITPRGESTPYGGLDIDPLRPGHLVVAVRKPVPANPIYYSADGGATWSGNRSPAASQESRVPWWPKTFFASALSSVRFAADPAHPDRVWFSDWYGVWRTEDISGTAMHWQNLAKLRARARRSRRACTDRAVAQRWG
ncbi:MAG: hypothetical protein K0R75_3201, partial [Paenibacillaceae bacterium]|nr:hypothetical protein [Paenibacillaceae bacterium]